MIFCCFPLLAEEDIVVHLQSHDQRHTIAVLPSKCDSDLLKIFCFDLNHNGYTKVVNTNGSLSDVNFWKQQGVDYVAQLTTDQNTLLAKVLNIKTGKMKQIGNLSLNGDLSKDRKKVHEVSDAICHSCFNASGIASSRILYTLRSRNGSNSSNWISNIWESDYDGANATQITHDGHLCVTPIYMPVKGDGFLFVSYKIGQPKIYRYSTKDHALSRLCYLRGNQLMPSISPKKDLVAFISDISGNPDLFIQEFSIEKGLIGKARQIFAAPFATQGTPTFAPDGDKLAFVSDKDGTARIYVMPVPERGAGDVKMISKRNRGNTSPAWSPDGKKIAYCSMTKGVRQIWVYDFDKNEEIQLTDGSSHKENPMWAANSLHLMFNTETRSSAELFLINLKQREAVKISSGLGEKRFPAWEPS